MKHCTDHASEHRHGASVLARMRSVLLWLCLLLTVPVTAHAAPQSFWHPEIAPAGPLVMVVSLDEQRVYVYRNGVVIGVSPISTGKPGYETPTGVYTILQKKREHYSNLYDDAPMPYMQRLTWDGVALHAGRVPDHAASHGCVRLPLKFAGQLYTATRPGDVVVVADAKVAPTRIAHPAAVAPVDLNGQPMLPSPDAGANTIPAADIVNDGPLSLIISTADRVAYVLRNGRLIAHTAVTVAAHAHIHGVLLYVLQDASDAGGSAGQDTPHRWSGYRIRGTGPVPAPAQLAKGVKLPQPFGAQLRAALRPGTTVLVTDLPGYGRARDRSYGALLESGASDQMKPR